ncbi:MAG: Arc family DNA-binding protein [Firmicutes bacterium]|nr:Arc family DNA-binding protein [Bacillota bacterium]
MDDKKQIPLRISNSLFVELQRWANDEFRSVNGQIEFLLTKAVKEYRHKDLEKKGEDEK